MTNKWVYLPNEGNAGMKDLLGGKGANLCEMWNPPLSLPVPPFFVVTTAACVHYMNSGTMPPGLDEQVREGLAFIEKMHGKKFGDRSDPLLLSVRSGAKFSMPGMMDTVLDIGLNAQTLRGLVKASGNERFALDCYRRLLQMFGDVVLGIDASLFEKALSRKCRENRTKDKPSGLSVAALKELIAEFEEIIRNAGKKMPSDPMTQLMMGIETVFKSWNSERATAYRNVHRIRHDLGTAVNVQAMVFGNVDDESGSGVLFTRDPRTGEKKRFAEFLFNSQGEEVVAGVQTPLEMEKLVATPVYEELDRHAEKLERHYRNMQDIEFTFEKGKNREKPKLYILQTRDGKRTGPAAVRIACEMYDEGLLKSPEEAVMQVDSDLLIQCLVPRIAPGQQYRKQVVGKGLNASPGGAVGRICFSSARAVALVERARRQGKPKPRLILVREKTNPDDFPGMDAADGMLTSAGGMTSHAAVVARQMGKACVTGCRNAKIDESRGILKIKGKVFKEGDWLTVDGFEGEVINKKLELAEPEPGPYFERIMQWAREIKRLGVRANADTARDAERARKWHAEGIGLCRTEHQFGGDRKMMVAELILILMNEEPSAAQLRRKEELLRELLEAQIKDFYGVFDAMNGLPVTVRLIDPPLHEFMPTAGDLRKERKLQKTKAGLRRLEEIKRLRREMEEDNPMLGLRGCRLGILYPVLYQTQVRAIVLAAQRLLRDKPQSKLPEIEIMIPLVMDAEELRFLKKQVDTVIDETQKKSAGPKLSFRYGTMIEVPRAALTAEEVAAEADFFSFGTNDLTQMAMGLSRDDTAAMINRYVEMSLLPFDPFQVLDRAGVGRLMRICIEEARDKKASIKLGICGEHGGEKNSVEFCHELGLDYVSCSAFRVPGAILAAAQAAVKKGRP